MAYQEQGGLQMMSGEGITPRVPYEQLSDQQLVELNDVWYKRVLAGRAHVEREGLLAAAYYLGQQYVELIATEGGSRLIVPPAKKGRVRTVDNMIKPILRQEQARLLKNRPQGQVVPDGEDPSDYEAARAAERVIEHAWREYDMEMYLEDATLWALMGGSALLNVHWDEEAISADGKQGDFLFRALGIFEFGVPNIRSTDINEQPYVMITKSMELDEIWETWGVQVEPEALDKYGQLEHRLVSAITYNLSQVGKSGIPGTAYGRNFDPAVPTCIVKETWIKPTPMNPKGLVLITAGGKILARAPWPEWTGGVYPFALMKYIAVPGSAYGQGLVMDLIPIQRRYNRALSIIIEAMNIRAQMGIAVPKGTQIKKMMGGLGTVYEIPPNVDGQAVQPINPADIGDLPHREVENCLRAFKDIAAQHEVTQGINPPGARAGTQIELLKEFDDSASVIPQRSLERACERVGQLIVDIAKNEWDEARVVTVIGDSMDIETRSLLSTRDLHGAGQYAVVPGSSWPFSKAERQNFVLQLVQTVDPSTGQPLISGEEALRKLDMGVGVRSIVHKRDEDVRHARRENQKYEALRGGRDPQTGKVPNVFEQVREDESMHPRSWHNHAVHIEEHNSLKKTPSYEGWPDWKKAIFDAHIDGHLLGMREQLLQERDNRALLEGLAPLERADQQAQSAAEETMRMMEMDQKQQGLDIQQQKADQQAEGAGGRPATRPQSETGKGGQKGMGTPNMNQPGGPS